MNRSEELLTELLECAEWHKRESEEANRGATKLNDPLLRFAWSNMAEAHRTQYEKITRIVNDLRFNL